MKKRKMMMPTTTIETIGFDVALDELKTRIKADYINTATRAGQEELSGYFASRVENFDNEYVVEEGRKYIKIIYGTSVWGFIVKKDGPKFKAGDLLKAASYSAPATNAARGNIFDNGYVVNWTGPLYLI